MVTIDFVHSVARVYIGVWSDTGSNVSNAAMGQAVKKHRLSVNRETIDISIVFLPLAEPVKALI